VGVVAEDVYIDGQQLISHRHLNFLAAQISSSPPSLFPPLSLSSAWLPVKLLPEKECSNECGIVLCVLWLVPALAKTIYRLPNLPVYCLWHHCAPLLLLPFPFPYRFLLPNLNPFSALFMNLHINSKIFHYNKSCCAHFLYCR